MPDGFAPPMPVWSLKFFHDLRSQTPTRLGYISRASEAEVERLALPSNAWRMRKPSGSKYAG